MRRHPTTQPPSTDQALQTLSRIEVVDTAQAVVEVLLEPPDLESVLGRCVIVFGEVRLHLKIELRIFFEAGISPKPQAKEALKKEGFAVRYETRADYAKIEFDEPPPNSP